MPRSRLAEAGKDRVFGQFRFSVERMWAAADGALPPPEQQCLRVLGWVRCFYARSNALTWTLLSDLSRPIRYVPGAGCWLHARRARARARTLARRGARTLSAHALHTKTARPPPAPPRLQIITRFLHTGCHVSCDALVSAWRSRHAVVCIRGWRRLRQHRPSSVRHCRWLRAALLPCLWPGRLLGSRSHPPILYGSPVVAPSPALDYTA